MRTLIATGNKAGIKMSCHHKAYNTSGAEWWVRVLVGNIVLGSSKSIDFAKEQLKKIDTLDEIIVNGEKIK